MARQDGVSPEDSMTPRTSRTCSSVGRGQPRRLWKATISRPGPRSRSATSATRGAEAAVGDLGDEGGEVRAGLALLEGEAEEGGAEAGQPRGGVGHGQAPAAVRVLSVEDGASSGTRSGPVRMYGIDSPSSSCTRCSRPGAVATGTCSTAGSVVNQYSSPRSASSPKA